MHDTGKCFSSDYGNGKEPTPDHPNDLSLVSITIALTNMVEDMVILMYWGTR